MKIEKALLLSCQHFLQCPLAFTEKRHERLPPLPSSIDELNFKEKPAGRLPRRRRKKYRNHENRLKTIEEKHEAGDYTLQELLRVYSRYLFVITVI